MLSPWLVPISGALSSTSLIVVGLVGIITGSSPTELPHLFLGLLVFGILGFLLSLPLIEKVWRKKSKKEVKQVTTECQIWPPPWTRTVGSLCQELRVRPSKGLRKNEASARLRKYGDNRIEVLDMPGYLSFFVKEIYEPTQLLLLSVGGLYVMFGSLEEGATAFIVIFLLVTAEVGTEWRAKRALATLKLSTPHDALVRREGQLLKIPAAEVVPGDIVQLETGREVPADVRILQSHFLEVDESKMTGESVPVSKDPFVLYPPEASLLERNNVALAGSAVTRGRGTGLVYQTGLSTSLGQVLSLSRKVKEKKTKLQKVLKELAWVLSIVAVGASTVGALLGFLKHMRWQDILLSGLSLAFATIPEELPILIAAVLAVGSQKLSLKNVYVKYLRAAENLGFVDTVLTDKTGTLTENKLSLHSGHFGTGLVPADVISSGMFITLDGFDRVGFEALLEAWVFMSDIGEDFEKKDESEVEIVRALVGETEAGPPEEEVVDEIHLDVTPVGGSVELSVNDATTTKQGEIALCASGDVFDRAILVGLGASLEEKPSSSGHLLRAKISLIQEHLQTVQRVKAGAKCAGETPFSPALKFASRTFLLGVDATSMYDRDDLTTDVLHIGHQKVFIKGAPELLLRNCSYMMQDGNSVPIDSLRKQLEEQIWAAASAGLRLIGYAHGDSRSDGDHVTTENGALTILDGTVFLGFLAFQDPIRQGAADAVNKCQQAGVRIILVTGDHLKTGLAVASSAGILDSHEYDVKGNTAGILCSEVHFASMEKDELRKLVTDTSVFARATPADKLAILEALQASKKCVMATGDGFNDAPILAKADVGVAMGKGTDVAREAASIVFVDDNFAMVPYALAEGRRLLDNLRKALAFYLGAKLGLICLFIVGTLWQSFPLSAIQIIVLELFMDLGASTSFVMEAADTDSMQRPPRHHSRRFFDTELIGGILVSAVCMTFTVLTSFTYGIFHGKDTAQTSAFLAWLLSHVFLAFNMRSIREPLHYKGVFSNLYMLVWLIAAGTLAVCIAIFHTLRTHLNLVPLPVRHWLVIVAISVCGSFWVEVVKVVRQWKVLKGQGSGFSSRETVDAAKQEEQTSLLASQVV